MQNNREAIPEAASWDQLMPNITEKDKRLINEAYRKFWGRNQILANIGTRTRPIFIRSNKPRVQYDPANAIQL